MLPAGRAAIGLAVAVAVSLVAGVDLRVIVPILPSTCR
jgi:hypothetical protein